MSMMGLSMIRIQTFVSLGLRLGLGSIALWGLGFTAPAQANEYQACTANLTSAKLDRLSIAQGCAEALHPEEVGSCVVQIVNDKAVDNKIVNTAALDACRRVRRPMELATCVTSIHESASAKPLSPAGSMAVLDSCRKSLLPERYGRCVVGFRNDPMQKVITDPAMTDRNQELDGLNTCLDATDYRKHIKLIPLSDLMGPAIIPTPTTPVVNPIAVPTAPTPTTQPAPKAAPIPQQF
jgi:hypothetical protein